VGCYISGSRLVGVLKLPDAIEILCSTAIDDEITTECSAACIIYKGFERVNRYSDRLFASFTQSGCLNLWTVEVSETLLLV
jgi:hypothetical protein